MFLASHEFILKANVIPLPKLMTTKDRYWNLIKDRRVLVKGTWKRAELTRCMGAEENNLQDH